MLVLTRLKEQAVFLDFSAMTDTELIALRAVGPIRMTVVEIRGDKVKLGFEAPRSVQVHRKEIWDERQRENSGDQ